MNDLELMIAEKRGQFNSTMGTTPKDLLFEILLTLARRIGDIENPPKPKVKPKRKAPSHTVTSFGRKKSA